MKTFGFIAAIVGVILIVAAFVNLMRRTEMLHWPASPPDMSAWNTCWKFTPQLDITTPELAEILIHTSGVGGLGSVIYAKKDAPVPGRNFVKITCPGGK